MRIGKPHERRFRRPLPQTLAGEDLFVIFCIRDILFGMGAHIAVEGFVVNSADGVRDAEDELLWDYS